MHEQVAVICVSDLYILRNRQDALHVLMAVGVNIVILVGHRISYDSRNEPSADAVPRHRSCSVQGNGLDKQQPNGEKTGSFAGFESPS